MLSERGTVYQVLEKSDSVTSLSSPKALSKSAGKIVRSHSSLNGGGTDVPRRRLQMLIGDIYRQAGSRWIGALS